MKIKVALIGISGYGKVHFQHVCRLVREKRAEISAAVVINPDQVPNELAVLREMGCAIYSGTDAMFADFSGKLDLVCIPTGIAFHEPMTLQALVFDLGNIIDMTTGLYGSNTLAGVGGSVAAGLIVEILLTFIFVLVVLGVTSKNHPHGSFGGLIIGLTLTLVHILGIGLTGTSVNPARSIGPAFVAAMNGNTRPLSVLWVFVVAPLVGAALAAAVYKFWESGKKE